MITGAVITLDVRGIDTINREVSGQLKRMQPGALRVVLRQWAARYRAAMRRKFVANSQGGGDWPPLAPSTLAKRGPGALILRDTGTLLAALSPSFTGAPGAIEVAVVDGIEVGYGGSSPHPTGDVSVATVAEAHQAGGGRLPRRMIIHEPDDFLLGQMASDAQRALKKEYGGE